MSQTNYWIVVASRDHALSGVEQGIVQANHGKPGPLRRMQPGDGVVIYAPKRIYGQTESYQRFVALGEVGQGPVFQADVSPDFRPFRRQVNYQLLPKRPFSPYWNALPLSRTKRIGGTNFGWAASRFQPMTLP